MGDGTTPFAGAMALGAVGDVDLAERVAAAIGTELRAMGVTVAYAPVCDLGMVGSSHTVSIGLRLTVVSNFLGASGRVAPGRLVGRGLPAAPTVRRQ